MGKALLEQINFKNYCEAKNIYVVSGILPSKEYISELSLENSNNIYLWGKNFSYTISTNNEEDQIYMNSNLSGMCKQLTLLQSTDLINKHIVNYHYVTNLHTAFSNCFNLKGTPISAKRIRSMYGTYYNCTNLNGFLYINANVNNMIGTFYNCGNIIGPAKCNDNVICMKRAYYNCVNLIGAPACGEKVKSLEDTYYNCYLLEGNPANCNEAIVTANAYYNCPNLYGNFYWMFNNFSQAFKVNSSSMFYNRNIQNQINIYVSMDSGIANALKNYGDSYGDIYNNQINFYWDNVIYVNQSCIVWNNIYYNTNVIELRNFGDGDCINWWLDLNSCIGNHVFFYNNNNFNYLIRYDIDYIEKIIYDPINMTGTSDVQDSVEKINVINKPIVFINGSGVTTTMNVNFYYNIHTIRYRRPFSGVNTGYGINIDMRFLPKQIDDPMFFEKILFNCCSYNDRTPSTGDFWRGYTLNSAPPLKDRTLYYCLDINNNIFFPQYAYSMYPLTILNYIIFNIIYNHPPVYALKNNYNYFLTQMIINNAASLFSHFNYLNIYDDNSFTYAIWNEVTNILQINNDYLCLYNNVNIILNNFPHHFSEENNYYNLYLSGSNLIFPNDLNLNTFYNQFETLTNPYTRARVVIPYSIIGMWARSAFSLCTGLKNILNLQLVNYNDLGFNFAYMFMGSDMESAYFPPHRSGDCSYTYAGTPTPIENVYLPGWDGTGGGGAGDHTYFGCFNIWGNLKAYFPNASYGFGSTICNHTFSYCPHIIRLGGNLRITNSNCYNTKTTYLTLSNCYNLIEWYDIDSYYQSVNNNSLARYFSLYYGVSIYDCPNLIAINGCPKNYFFKNLGNKQTQYTLINYYRNYIAISFDGIFQNCPNIQFIPQFNTQRTTLLDRQYYLFRNSLKQENFEFCPSYYLTLTCYNSKIQNFNCYNIAIMQGFSIYLYDCESLQNVKYIIGDHNNYNFYNYNNAYTPGAGYNHHTFSISFENCHNLSNVIVEGYQNIAEAQSYFAWNWECSLRVTFNNINLSNFTKFIWHENVITNLEPYRVNNNVENSYYNVFRLEFRLNYQ